MNLDKIHDQPKELEKDWINADKNDLWELSIVDGDVLKWEGWFMLNNGSKIYIFIDLGKSKMYMPIINIMGYESHYIDKESRLTIFDAGGWDPTFFPMDKLMPTIISSLNEN